MQYPDDPVSVPRPPLPSPPPRLGWVPVFDTAGVPAHDRYRLWRDTNTHGLSEVYDTAPTEPFSMATEWIDLGTLAIADVRISAQEWRRDAGRLRDDNDELSVNIRHVGGGYGDMDGRNLVAPGGSIILTDMARTNAHHSEASTCMGFRLPRKVAEQFLPSVRSLHGHVVMPQHAALLNSHLMTLRHGASSMPASSGPAIAQTILDLFAVVVHASLGDTPRDIAQHERALGVQLRDEIERNLGSPSLSAARLSRTLGVSRSTLYRLLQEEGGVQAYIRTRRLARVAAALRRADGQETIAVLAERWGFCDAAYLGRAFRETYGMTPGSYREMHGAAPRG